MVVHNYHVGYTYFKMIHDLQIVSQVITISLHYLEGVIESEKV